MLKITVETTCVNHNVLIINNNNIDYTVKAFARPGMLSMEGPFVGEDLNQCCKAHAYANSLTMFLKQSHVHVVILQR